MAGRKSPHGAMVDAEVIERIIAERKSAEARAERAKPARNQGHPTKEDQGDKGTTSTFTGVRGGNPDYRMARIARDAPEVLERMKAGHRRIMGVGGRRRCHA
jgi:hypothetical protein